MLCNTLVRQRAHYEHIISFLKEYNTPPQLLTQALDEGRCLLLFDGLDEIANRQVRARIARSLASLASQFPGNRVIIGSRPAGESESEGVLHPLQFHRCQIERFTSENVQRFFHFWYALDRGLTPEHQHETADALYARVQATPATMQLATTPLLSTILVLIWRNEGNLPERRVELYGRCCRVLIERWEASHDVAYRGKLAGMDWEDHLGLLAPLAYTIHSQEQRTSATREELVPLLAQALQTAGYTNEQTAATREARHFLDALGLRSGLLQYMGDDKYGFPHLTFQEYLAARYIAAQPDPEYIDLVMEHLHEAWWQEVHLLTIAHLGSGSAGARKASALILAILHRYTPPSRIFRSSKNWWARMVVPGKFLPQVQLERRIAWILAREFELAAKGYAECVTAGTTAMVGAVLSVHAALLVRLIIYDEARRKEQEPLLILACQLLQRQDNEAVAMVLLEALHDTDSAVRERVAEILGQVGVGNEAVARALLEALHDTDSGVRWRAAESLGQVGVGKEAVARALVGALHDTNFVVRERVAKSLGQVGVGNETVARALLEALHDTDWDVRSSAAESLCQVGVGNEAVVRVLLEALHGTKWKVRLNAAEILGQVGVGNEAVVRALLEALHDTDRAVRRLVAEILGQVGVGNEAVRVLLEALHDKDSDVRRLVAEILGQVGVGNEAVVRALLDSAKRDGWYIWREVVESLSRLETENTIQLREMLVVLNRYLYDVDNRMRGVALVSIRRLLNGRPIPSY